MEGRGSPARTQEARRTVFFINQQPNQVRPPILF